MGKAELCRLNDAQETKMICIVSVSWSHTKSVQRLTLIMQDCDFYPLKLLGKLTYPHAKNCDSCKLVENFYDMNSITVFYH